MMILSNKMCLGTFIEVAIAQKSPNIEVIFERSVLANRKKLWLIIQVLKKESKVKNNQLSKQFNISALNQFSI